MHQIFTTHQKTIVFTKIYLEGVVQSCFVKKVFLEISQNSQKNTCARVFFKIKLQAPGSFGGCFWFLLDEKHLFSPFAFSWSLLSFTKKNTSLIYICSEKKLKSVLYE